MTETPHVHEGAHALFVTHRAKSGRRDDVLATWSRHLRPLIEANPDHLAYAYCFDDADADVVRVFQLYRSAAAADAFLQLPGYAEYLAEVMEHVAEPPRLDTATPQWMK
jgi:quinol monooxygenase YgiN